MRHGHHQHLIRRRIYAKNMKKLQLFEIEKRHFTDLRKNTGPGAAESFKVGFHHQSDGMV
jgi:hypothetical protein